MIDKVKHTPKRFDEYIRDIQALVEEYCGRMKIEDIRKISQKEYNAVLMYVGMTLFPKVYKTDGTGKSSAPLDDVMFLRQMADYYIFLANSHNKIVNVTGYSYILNINSSVLFSWGRKEEDNYNYINNSSKGRADLTRVRFEIVKDLIQANEQNHADDLASGKTNPVGTIAVLNRRFGWSDERERAVIEDHPDKIGLANLPQIEQKAKNTTYSG